ncbi:MAG: winged helix-turn-helix domain-containing protein [Terracidiphilus sp.]
MPIPAEERRQVRFGPFTVDFASRELSNGAGKIRLQGVPYQILEVLLKRPGEWVTRDELRQQLWPPDVFVDFDHSINTAIVKLRKALGDDADEPHYIETLLRHGYRFIAQVEETQPRGKATDSEKKRYGNVIVSVAVGLAVLLVAAGWLNYPWRRAAALTSKDTIVVTDFENKTGESVFDGTLRQALGVELEQSPFLNVLSDEKVNETLKKMGHPLSDRISIQIGRELCLRTGSKAMLTGSIARMGSQYVVSLGAIACGTGDNLAMEEGEAATRDDVLKTLSRASSRLRGKLGESLPSVQKFDAPVEATTSSLEALKYFSAGLAIRHKEGDAPSISFLKKAIELDPDFPMAYSELALAYDNLREPSRALEYATKAYQLRDRATKEEKLNIAALYFNATGDLDKEIETYQLWAADYPNSAVPHANLGADFSMLGQNEKARIELEKALRLAPDVVNVYTGLAATYLYLGRLRDADDTFKEEQTHNLDDGGMREYIYYLAFLEGDVANMEQQIAWATGKPGDEDALLPIQSDTEAYYGRMAKARELSRRAVNSAVDADSKETAALWQVNAALREAEIGESDAALSDVNRALALSEGRDVKESAALALARAGDPSRARKLVTELVRDYPANTVLKLYWIPTIQAAIQLDKGDASGAIAQLDAAMPYELAEGLNLYPAYLRGQAYLAEHNGLAAAAEFQKLLDHPGVVANFITGSLAQFQIARAYAMAGKTDKAKAAYQRFLDLWKDADPRILILKQARVDGARLR